MKFKNDWWGKLKLGIVFSLFMLAVSLIITLVVLPVVLIPFGIMLFTGSNPFIGVIGGALSLIVLVLTLFLVGWAVFYFYRKNVFIYKRR